MTVMTLQNYAEGKWFTPATGLSEIRSAVTGEPVALAGAEGLDMAAMADYARRVGGPALRKMTFHDRAKMLKAVALHLMENKEAMYEIAFETGATRKDNWIDIEGGIGTLFAFASVGRRKFPDARILIDGEPEIVSRNGTFIGQHVYTPLQGVAVHINAYNFPVWGMLEKLGPSLIAGVPAIVKPAADTAYVTEVCVRLMVDSGLLPEGAVQLVVGRPGDMLAPLGCQDLVGFTGSAATAAHLQSHPVIAENAVRFVAERDSLNACVLGPDAKPGTPEFDLFVKEVCKEMTAKAGQKCTAIRRALVPADIIDDVQKAMADRLAKVTVGNPRLDDTMMGAVVSLKQREDVRANVAKLAQEAEIVFGGADGAVAPNGADAQAGAFLSPILLRANDPWQASAVHDVEAFGPVSTLMPYKDMDDAVALANRGLGSLAMTVVTHDPDVATDMVMGAGAFHGRIQILDRTCAKESTGHGSPLPVLVHGGPGRAGGGEELGGARGVKHYMQRTALQGDPGMLTKVTGRYLPGAPRNEGDVHPFRMKFAELEIGYTIRTKPRTVTLEDIEHFAHFTGDTFYAHMDEEAAKANPFFPGRVAHGYLILSFAAGLFVDPAPGPVLANYGLDELRFLEPVSPGDTLEVALTVKDKKSRNEEYGEVHWDVLVTKSTGETVATYTLLTMTAH